MAIDGQAFDNRYTLYFDFLGTSDATTSWTVQKVHEFVDLLRGLAYMRGAQAIDGTPMDDGSYKITMKPEISTFSDHIVISYPEFASDEHDPHKIIQPLWAKFVCQDSIRIVSAVAKRGLRIGLLMRGGLSFGELFHSEDTVFGEALVDAHDLESRVADVPRIVVSERVLHKLDSGPATYPDILLQDTDQRWHLNYFSALTQHDVGIATEESVRRWTEAMRTQIDESLTTLQIKPRVKAKWTWFDERFQAAIKVKPAHR